MSLAKKKKGKSQDDSQSNEDNGSVKKDVKHESDLSDSDDNWNNKAGKTKKKKAPSKRSKRKMTKSSSEDSASEKEPAKQLSEPEEGIQKLNLSYKCIICFVFYVWTCDFSLVHFDIKMIILL